jgi:hypothetical protein
MATSITALDAANVNEGTSGSVPLGKELVIMSRAVTGGTLYIVTARGSCGDLVASAPVFVPAGATPATRRVKLSEAKLNTGLPLPGSASGTSPTLSRNGGTSFAIVGAATSSSAVTTNTMWEVVLPDTYVAGSAITWTVDANYTGSGTVTAASTTLNLTADAESDAGAETALTITGGAQQFTGTAATYQWTLSAANAAAASLVAGSRLVFTVVMLVTTSAGAATGQINSVTYTA